MEESGKAETKPSVGTGSAPRAYSYVRFSTPDQERGDSYRRQTELAGVWAATHGLSLDDSLTLQDLGVSAYKGRNARTGALGRFLQAIDDGLVAPGSYLLVENLDRISRQDPWDALPVFQQIINAGVLIVTLQDDRVYSREEMRANPMRILESLFVMVRANEESATKSRRLSAAWKAKRSRATERPMTGICPAWLRLNKAAARFEVVEERAEVVRRIYQAALDGVGKHSIAKALNEDCVPVFGEGARQGLHWHRSYVAKLLASHAVIGTMVPHVTEWADGKKHRRPLDPVANYYPAVIDLERFHRVQALSNDTANPRRGANASRPVANIFGGLAKCPLCNSAMTMTNKGHPNWRYLVCTRARSGAGCRYQLVRYNDVESGFLRDVPRLAVDCPAPDDERDYAREVESIDDNLAAWENTLAGLLDTAGSAGRSSPALVNRIREVEDEIEELREERRRLNERWAAAMGPGLSGRLDTLSAVATADPLDRTKLNAALRVLLASVVVNRGTGELELNWKHGGQSSVMFAWPADDP